MGRLKDIKVFGELETLARKWTSVDSVLSCFSPEERRKKRRLVDEEAIQYIGKQTDDDSEILRYAEYYEATKTALNKKQ